MSAFESEIVEAHILSMGDPVIEMTSHQGEDDIFITVKGEISLFSTKELDDFCEELRKNAQLMKLPLGGSNV